MDQATEFLFPIKQARKNINTHLNIRSCRCGRVMRGDRFSSPLVQICRNDLHERRTLRIRGCSKSVKLQKCSGADFRSFVINFDQLSQRAV